MQKHKTKNSSSEQDSDEEVQAKDLHNADLAKETDDILDEIDKVLEPNAQEFVEQYRQQGGQ